MTTLAWIRIVRCLCQSAMLSGLNRALFTIGELELRLQVAKPTAWVMDRWLETRRVIDSDEWIRGAGST